MSSLTTTDHSEIRGWIEDRGGVPATVEDTRAEDEAGILGVDFPAPGSNDAGLTTISWEQFFDKFEQQQLAFLHQNETADGSTSRFHKFVNR